MPANLRRPSVEWTVGDQPNHPVALPGLERWPAARRVRVDHLHSGRRPPSLRRPSLLRPPMRMMLELTGYSGKSSLDSRSANGRRGMLQVVGGSSRSKISPPHQPPSPKPSPAGQTSVEPCRTNAAIAAAAHAAAPSCQDEVPFPSACACLGSPFLHMLLWW